MRPPHPLVEHMFRTEELEADKALELELPAHVKSAFPEIALDVPADIPSRLRDWIIRVRGPQTGHHVSSFLFDDGMQREFEVPEGDYTFELDRFTIDMCGMGSPRPRSLVPDTANWSASKPNPVVLRPQLGSRLKLKVNHPIWHKTPEEREKASVRGTLSKAPLRSYGGPADELVTVQLVSKASGRSYELKWGWRELGHAIPWDYFPMGKNAYQIVPVPFGEYELILRGIGTEELRCKVTMGPEETTALTLNPIARKP